MNEHSTLNLNKRKDLSDKQNGLSGSEDIIIFRIYRLEAIGSVFFYVSIAIDNKNADITIIYIESAGDKGNITIMNKRKH